MTPIAESYMAKVAAQLAYISGLPPSPYPVVAYYNKNLGRDPLISETFDALKSLSKKHPLRKKYDFKKIEKGYAILEAFHGRGLKEGDATVLEMMIYSDIF